MGIFFISLPLILTYYIALYHLAMVTLPANNPEDRAEKKKMQDEINQTFLRQRDSNTEFLTQFYDHR